MTGFEWDDRKARINLREHGVDFSDAVSVLEDPRAMTISDDREFGEERLVTIGLDLFGRMLVVVYTWRGEGIPLISARKATPRERRGYGIRR